MSEQTPSQNDETVETEAVEATQNNIDVQPGLEEQIRLIELQAAEHHDAWLRAKAETENVRRRAQEDVVKASKFAIEKFATELLPVKDSLEQTLALGDASTPESIREGIELTLRNLTNMMEKCAIAEINPVGEKFDPHKHQAMSAVPSELPANTVIQVFQKGYTLGGRVLRPALISVSSGEAA